MKRDLLAGRSHGSEAKLVGFMVGDVQYGVDIMRVREIVNPRSLVEIPTAPEYVVGVADHRDAVVPVVDVRRRLGLPPAEQTRRSKWLLVSVHDRTVGLLVEQVTEVIRLDAAEARDRHPLMDGEQGAWIEQVFGTAGGLVFRMDLEAIIGGAAELPDGDGEEQG